MVLMRAMAAIYHGTDDPPKRRKAPPPLAGMGGLGISLTGDHPPPLYAPGSDSASRWATVLVLSPGITSSRRIRRYALTLPLVTEVHAPQ